MRPTRSPVDPSSSPSTATASGETRSCCVGKRSRSSIRRPAIVDSDRSSMLTPSSFTRSRSASRAATRMWTPATTTSRCSKRRGLRVSSRTRSRWNGSAKSPTGPISTHPSRVCSVRTPDGRTNRSSKHCSSSSSLVRRGSTSVRAPVATRSRSPWRWRHPGAGSSRSTHRRACSTRSWNCRPSTGSPMSRSSRHAGRRHAATRWTGSRPMSP